MIQIIAFLADSSIFLLGLSYVRDELVSIGVILIETTNHHEHI